MGTTTNRDIAPVSVRPERDFQAPEGVTRHEALGRVANDNIDDQFDVPAWLRKQRD